jgi:hypothetical protein
MMSKPKKSEEEEEEEARLYHTPQKSQETRVSKSSAALETKP